MDLARNMMNFYRMYRINSDLRRCVQEIQQTSGKSGYSLRQYVSSQDYFKEVADPAVDDLLNFGKGWKALKSEIIKHYCISGNVFIEKLFDERTGKKIVGYNVLDTRYMSIICDKEYNPIKYIYRDVKNNQVLEYKPEFIFHFIDNVDMDNPAFAMSLLEGLVPDVFGDDQAAISNAYFFQNDAMPSSLYILEE